MSEAEKKSGGEGKGGIIALALATLVAAGAGAAHGLQTFGVIQSAAPSKTALGKAAPATPASAALPAHSAPASGGHGAPAASGAASKPTEKVKLPSKVVSRAFQPLITNILMPPDVWVRLEGAVLYDQAEVEDPDMMLSELTGDLLAYLRSLTMRELQGADGLMFVRQDMRERIKLRTQGKARDIIIQSLVMQ